MTKWFLKNACLVAAVSCVGYAVTANADVIYDNTTTDLNTRFYLPADENGQTTEVADQIVFDFGPDYSSGFLTNFSFEFFGVSGSEGAFAGDGLVEGRVVFYRMDGPLFSGYASPGNSFYDSGWFSVGAPTERSTMNFNAGLDFPVDGLFLPTADMAWSIQFRGIEGTDLLGVDLYSPPSVGQNPIDYWLRVGEGWELRRDSAFFPINFAARFQANIPEPSAMTLLLLGAAGAFIARRRRSRQ